MVHSLFTRLEGAISLLTEVSDCRQCGTCCVAPDISSLGKPLGVRCRLLGADHRCLDYEGRPAVCRGYRADELCSRIAAPTMDERVRRYRAIFDV